MGRLQGLVAVITGLQGWLGRKPWALTNDRVAAIAVFVMDGQLLLGLVLYLVVCHAADTVGGMQEAVAPHRLVLRQHDVSVCQLLWHARGQ